MKTKIEDMTIGEAREIEALFGNKNQNNDHPYEVGANYFIRTVTHHFTGRLVQVTQQELVLEKACWIADDGRFADAVAKSSFNEVEPFPTDKKVIIGRATIIDAVEIDSIPTSQK